MKENNKLLIVLIAVVLLAGIVVVFILAGGNKESEQVVVQPALVDEVTAVDTEIPATEIQQSVDPTQSEVVEDQILPTPRAGLESTDPATVSLVSGEIQLVEVFAFW